MKNTQSQNTPSISHNTMALYNIIWCVFIVNCHFVFTLDSCSLNLKCNDCIRDPHLCAWCPTNNFNRTRCKSLNFLKNDWCPEKKQLENPINFVNASDNRKFSYDSKNVVQVKPQRYTMKLRPGQSENFTFSFQGAQDLPVDLYFLLDASQSMSAIRDLTAEQSENIYTTMKNMTKNVQLGYGSFVDKRAFPFTQTFNTEETYSFRHRLTLTHNFTQFKDIIKATPIGKNRDYQEGGLDALAQVMACPNIIKWREDSRKIIIFVTNGEYHAAGDGRTAGIFEPYDGECYTEDGIYTKELEMDYPSLGMINKLAIDQNIIIIFFVNDAVFSIYNKLSKVISGSKLAKFGETSTKESIPKTLKEIYEKISKKVILKKQIKTKYSKNIEVNFHPNCTSDKSGSECNVEVGKEKQFMGTIKVLKYDRADNMAVDIAFQSISEKLRLDIEVIKDCNCTSSGIEENSTFCHGEKRICGECDCGEKRYGERCICEKTSGTAYNSTLSCIQHERGEVCGSHGICECGACRCRPGYNGKFCECNDLSCPMGEGKLCSGKGRGKCRCGKCNCESGWEGDACQCSTYNCVVDGKVCNGLGHCECGACKCNPISEWDKRSNRDENCKLSVDAGSHSLQCKLLEECAICNRKAGKEYCNSCDDAINITVLEVALPEEYLNSSTWSICPEMKVAIGCYSKFVYSYIDTKYALDLVIGKENCAQNYYKFGGIFLLVLVVVGVLTLVAWKLLTDAHDRHEYKLFLEKTKYDGAVSQNPLYEAATASFQNPGFRKRSYRL